MPGPAQPSESQARVVFGVVVMVVGAILLLDRLEWWGVRLNVPLWPWVLVVLGLVRLSDRSTDATGPGNGRRSAACLLFLGTWGLLDQCRLFGVHSWPVLLNGAGALIVWRSMDPTPEGTTCTAARCEP